MPPTSEPDKVVSDETYAGLIWAAAFALSIQRFGFQVDENEAIQAAARASAAVDSYQLFVCALRRQDQEK